ncbi:MAG: alpha/beta hydrolase fold protein [Chloroflexi bacterium OLB14]|nr:MAG: alpha/beta hydrolase fold protein [Chloroflexi bacterium OLB14]
MPFPYLDETKALNESTRKEADGSFIQLSDGVTHYQLSGDVNDIPVVLVHGFSVPYFIYDPTFEFLSKQNFRVLRYDLFGRGFSDRPKLQYNIQLFVKQLKELLEALNFKDINLVGLSMGGPITAKFVEEYPQVISKHILIDPAGAKALQFSSLRRLAQIPMLGELVLGLFGSGSMVKSVASDLFTAELVEKFQAQYKIQMQYQGFKRAILSTIRNGMLDDFLELYKRIGKLEKPTLLFWGKQDATVPFEHSELILQAIPHTEFHVIENCGHIPHYEKPEEVNPILLKFLL